VKAVIMQPTYLPWLGYFDLIDQADTFVFLDSVQFEKQSWQQRNKLRTTKGLEWITVPVLIKGRFGQLIKDVEINPLNFPDKHIKQIKQNYSRTPSFKAYFDELSDVLTIAAKDLSLCNLNIAMIKWLSSQLSVSARFIRSSELGLSGKRTQLLISILKSIHANTYLSPLGSWEYLKEEWRLFRENGIEVEFQGYFHPQYRQIYNPFVPNASAIDLLLNEGEQSGAIIRSGRRDVIRPEELMK
jgi:hypothetical protein